MIRGRWTALIAVIFVVAAGVWYFGSPAYTLHQMKSAAEAQDSEAFASYIDFPALREDLKAELRAQMIQEMQKGDNLFAGLGLAMGSAMLGPMIDSMISPAGVRTMFISARTRRAAPADGSSDLQKGVNLAEPVSKDAPVIERRGLSEFLVTSKDQPGSGMVFKRHGLSWKLSGMDLPAETAAKDPV